MIRTRFAPSPTGYLHVGGLRTALYAYLFAKKEGGKLILRIEDTDQKRFVEGATESLIKTLNDFGINSDEGPILNNNGDVEQIGDHGPYIQSQRKEIYHKYIQQLIESGKAYYAFETPEELDQMRKDQEAKGLPPRYNKQALNLSKEIIEKNLSEEKPYVIRLNVTPGEIIRFKDIVRGVVEFNSSDIDDQVLMKSDGLPTYHLAVIVDDHLMNISHVIRAEEWIPSTPKHILLYRAFGWEIPQYAHLPQVLNEDKTKLSKRQGDVAAEDFIKKGYLKEALINFISLLGWNPKTDEELFTLKELEDRFILENVNKSGAVFNRDKLIWFNKQYIKNLPDSQYFEHCKPFLDEYKSIDQELLMKATLLEKERIEKFEDISELIDFVFKLPEYDKELLSWKKNSVEKSQENLQVLLKEIGAIDEKDFNAEKINEIIFPFIKENNYKVGEMLSPLRIALAGKKNSPGPYEIAEVIGKKETVNRIEKAINA